MHVDRARFLLLTVSIASASCASPERQASAPAADDRAPPPVIDVAAPDDQAVLRIVGESGPQPGSLAPEVAPPPEPAEGGWSGDGELESPFRDGSPTAAKATRSPKSPKLSQQCRSIKPPPGPDCESFGDTLPECEAYAQALEPEAAERSVRCLTRKSGTQAICKFGVTSACFLEGVRSSRVTPDAARQCAPALRGCAGQRWREPDMTAGNCQAAVSGVLPHLRDALLSCIVESCGIANCYYDISSF